MESSPLISAQSHAHKASRADTPTSAIDEHGQAAGQFAKAAKDTTNSEAFRTLKLLEQHHEKLAKIIKFRSIHPAAPTEILENRSQVKEIKPGSSQIHPQASVKNPHQSEIQPSPLVHRPARDAGSSIVSNLASARGIPANRQKRSAQVSSPAVTQQNAEGKIVSPSKRAPLIEPTTQSTRSSGSSEKPRGTLKSDKASNMTTSKESKEAAPLDQTVRSDESFNRFYSTMETLFLKLSAPLAFAGLPLTSEPDPTIITPTAPAPTSRTASQKPKPRTRATASPEYSGHFSPAAMRAVREENGTNGINPAESFFFVPTSGGTMPYASMLARHTQQFPKHRAQPPIEDPDLSDEFVDARETPGNSPKASRKQLSATRGAGGKTFEELELENTGLRSICDELSQRLWQFEISSQMSQQALHQSIRAGLKGSPAASETAAPASAGTETRLKALEQEMTGMRKENEKLKSVVGKYRERWEKLKEGAKMRREGTGGLEKCGDQKENEE